MCGIVGYVGNRDVKEVLLSGLGKLEYRGYDSAGIALTTKKEIQIIKENGRLEKLEKKTKNMNIQSNLGIGHTRWATHGKPSDLNSHPHFNKDKSIVLVHNGIIENYLELKNELIKEGYDFISETDTEVIPHLIQKLYQGSALETLKLLQEKLRGSYALAILFNNEPDTLYCIKKDSPLIVGKGKDENFIASDIPAFLEYTREVIILEDKQMAKITADEVKIYDENGEEVATETKEITWSIAAAEKGGYDHFMQKEIFEQPKVIRDTLSGRLSALTTDVQLFDTKLDINHFNRIYFVACGTAYHAALIGKSLIEKMIRIPIEVDVSSEFRYKDPIVDNKTLVVVISQSGETADTLAALRLAKEKKATTLGIVNVVGSSIDRESDITLYTSAGPEIAVASTKAYTAQLVCIYLLTLYIALKKGKMTEPEFEEAKKEILGLSHKVEMVLEKVEDIREIAKKYYKSKNVFYIGRGMDYYVAKEGSLKLKEIAYVHSEAYEAGELKHGPIALMENATLVIGILMDDRLIEKTISNLKEVKARGAKVLVIAEEGTDLSDTADSVIYIPSTKKEFSSVLANIPQQLIAYYMSIFLENDVDKPRNLAKSVTVE